MTSQAAMRRMTERGRAIIASGLSLHARKEQRTQVSEPVVSGAPHSREWYVSRLYLALWKQERSDDAGVIRKRCGELNVKEAREAANMAEHKHTTEQIIEVVRGLRGHWMRCAACDCTYIDREKPWACPDCSVLPVEDER